MIFPFLIKKEEKKKKKDKSLYAELEIPLFEIIPEEKPKEEKIEERVIIIDIYDPK